MCASSDSQAGWPPAGLAWLVGPGGLAFALVGWPAGLNFGGRAGWLLVPRACRAGWFEFVGWAGRCGVLVVAWCLGGGLLVSTVRLHS